MRIQLRRGTAAQWTTADPVLAQGELGAETDTGKLKVGDGTSNWAALNYSSSSSPAIKVIYVDAQAGADDDARWAAAITALGTSPGVIVAGAKWYQWNTGKTLAYPGQGIVGQGAGATVIDYRGTGDCLRVWDSTAPPDASDSPGASAPMGGFRIYGWDNTNTNVCGMHMGDLLYPTVTDVRIDGFNNAGCKGFWGENRYTWTERALLQMHVEHCTDNYVFETHASHPLGWSSWDYNSTFQLSVIAAPNQNAVTWKNNVAMEGVDFHLVGNLYPGDSNTGVCLQIGTTSGDTSILTGRVRVNVETINPTGSSPVGHKDINTPNTSGLAMQGDLLLNFSNAAGAFVAGTATRSTIRQLAGFSNCPSLGRSNSVLSDSWQHKVTAGGNLAYDPFMLDAGNTREWFSTAGVLTLSYSTEQSKSGPRSLKVITAAATSGNNDGFFLSTHNLGGENTRTPASALKVSAGDKFYLEVWARQKSTNTNTAGNLLLNAVVNDSAGVNPEAYPTAVTVTQSSISNSGWTKVSGILTVPSGYDLLWPVVNLVGHTVASQSWYFDNARIVDVTALTDLPVTMGSKTLTGPKVDQILDVAGNAALDVQANATPVNRLGVANRATGSAPYVYATGSDTNIDVGVVPKGAAGILAYCLDSGTSLIPLKAQGANANVGWNLTTQGTGQVQVNGSTVLTGQTPRLGAVKDTNGNNSITIGAAASAVNYFEVDNAATGSWPGVTAVGSDSNIGILWVPKGTGYVMQWAGSNSAATWGVDGSLTNIDQNVLTKGTGRLQVNGVNVPTVSSTDTETNKTFTDPKINKLKDTNGNTILDMGATASAVNYPYVFNAATGGTPSIGVAGPDTNVSLNVQTQGTGRVLENGNIVGSVVSVPASSGATGKQGQMAGSSTAFYFCYAANSWLRINASGFSSSF